MALHNYIYSKHQDPTVPKIAQIEEPTEKIQIDIELVESDAENDSNDSLNQNIKYDNATRNKVQRRRSIPLTSSQLEPTGATQIQKMQAEKMLPITKVDKVEAKPNQVWIMRDGKLRKLKSRMKPKPKPKQQELN